MRRVIPLLVFLPAASCGSIANSPPVPIPAAVILNSIKCEMAQYFADERRRDSARIRFLESANPFTVTLTLKVVDTTAGKVGAGLGPFILPYGSASLGFSGSGSKAITTTMEENILLNPYSVDTSVCDAARKQAGLLEPPGLGVRERLNEFAEQLVATSAGHPMMLFDKFSLSKEFAVTRSVQANGAIGFQAIPLNLTAEASQTREDVQTMKLSGATNKPSSVKSP